MKQNNPTVFISFNNGSKDFVDCLEHRLSKVAEVLRYEDSILAWGSFSRFMDTVKDQDFAVLVLSDAYLKSYACMYEVMQAMKSTNWQDRVLIALMPDSKPYKDDERIKYLQYWAEQYNDICEKLEKLPSGIAQSLEEKRDKIESVVDSLDTFLAFVADANCPPIYNVIEEICERVKISKKAVFTYAAENGKPMNMRLMCILDYIKANPLSTVSQISEAVGISRASTMRYIKKLVEAGAVSVEGTGRIRWYLAA